MKIVVIYILFWLYSFLGWLMETTLVSLQSKKFINRGFFMGPYCPIYGTGGVLLLVLSPYKDSPFLVFILSIVICSIIEYLTSYILEMIYKVRWWDYSDRMFNLNGRVCLFNSICFGLLGMLMVSYLNPVFLNLITSLSDTILTIIALTILIITLIDMSITFSIMFDIRKTIINLKDKTITSIFKKNQDNTEEVSKRVKNILKEKSIIHKHLSNAFSDLKVYKNNFFAKTEELLKRKREQKLETKFIIGTLISIIVGYLIGKYLNQVGLVISICLVLNLIILRLLSRKNDE